MKNQTLYWWALGVAWALLLVSILLPPHSWTVFAMAAIPVVLGSFAVRCFLKPDWRRKR